MNEAKHLRDLLTAWVHDAAPPTTLPQDLPPEEFYHAVFHHQLSPWFAEHPLSAALPDALRRELCDDVEVHSRTRLNHLLGLQRLQKDFPEGHVPVVLKGWALTGEMYPHLSLRTGWDIDVLLPGPDAAGAVHTALVQAGWKANSPLPEDHHHLPDLAVPESKLHVEIHHDLGRPPLPDSLLGEILAEAEPFAIGTWDVQRLGPAGRIVHHLIHVGADPTGAPFLRNLAEAAWMIQRATPEARARAEEWAQAAERAGHPVRSLWGLAGDWFGIPTPEKTPSSTHRRFLEAELLHLPPYPKFHRAIRECTRRRIEALQERRNASLFAIAGQFCREFAEARRDWTKKDLPQRPELNWRRIGDIVLVQGLEGRAHVLNPLAARLWEAADGTRDWKTVCRELGVRNVKDLWRAVMAEVEGRAPPRPTDGEKP